MKAKPVTPQQNWNAIENRRQAEIGAASGVSDGTNHCERTTGDRNQAAWGEVILHGCHCVVAIVTGWRPGWVFIQNSVSVSESPSSEIQELLQQLDGDRSWLLQQIDGGRWPDLRLDLAALERELGQMITRATELEEDASR